MQQQSKPSSSELSFVFCKSIQSWQSWNLVSQTLSNQNLHLPTIVYLSEKSVDLKCQNLSLTGLPVCHNIITRKCFHILTPRIRDSPSLKQILAKCTYTFYSTICIHFSSPWVQITKYADNTKTLNLLVLCFFPHNSFMLISYLYLKDLQLRQQIYTLPNPM